MGHHDQLGVVAAALLLDGLDRDALLGERGCDRGQHAGAVLGDLVTVARNRLAGTRGAGESAYADRAVQPMGETRTRYHVAIDVEDRAGVLAAVATAFAEQGVSIQTVKQEGRGDDAQLVVVSHRATDAALAATVEHLRGMEIVREVTSVMRVEGDKE